MSERIGGYPGSGDAASTPPPPPIPSAGMTQPREQAQADIAYAYGAAEGRKRGFAAGVRASRADIEKERKFDAIMATSVGFEDDDPEVTRELLARARRTVAAKRRSPDRDVPGFGYRVDPSVTPNTIRLDNLMGQTVDITLPDWMIEAAAKDRHRMSARATLRRARLQSRRVP